MHTQVSIRKENTLADGTYTRTNIHGCKLQHWCSGTHTCFKCVRHTIGYNAMQCDAMQYNTTKYNTIQYNQALTSMSANRSQSLKYLINMILRWNKVAKCADTRRCVQLRTNSRSALNAERTLHRDTEVRHDGPGICRISLPLIP